jgi:hypothetical protein
MKRMVGLILGAFALMAGCSDDTNETPASSAGAGAQGGAGGSQAGHGGGGGDGGHGEGGGDACEQVLSLDLEAVRGESIALLRAVFDKADGFEGGEIVFRDGVSATDDCVSYDHAEVVYVVDAPPEVLPVDGIGAGPWSLAASWGLNGLPTVTYRPSKTHTDGYLMYELSVLSGCAIFDAALSLREQQAFVQSFAAQHPPRAGDIGYMHLDQIGIVCFYFNEALDDYDGIVAGDQDRVLLMLEVVPALAAAPEIDSVQVDSFVYKIPYEFGMPEALGDSGTVYPECLRELRPALEAQGAIFRTLTSLPPPFGEGWKENPDVALCR